MTFQVGGRTALSYGAVLAVAVLAFFGVLFVFGGLIDQVTAQLLGLIGDFLGTLGIV